MVFFSSFLSVAFSSLFPRFLLYCICQSLSPLYSFSISPLCVRTFFFTCQSLSKFLFAALSSLFPRFLLSLSIYVFSLYIFSCFRAFSSALSTVCVSIFLLSLSHALSFSFYISMLLSLPHSPLITNSPYFEFPPLSHEFVTITFLLMTGFNF